MSNNRKVFIVIVVLIIGLLVGFFVKQSQKSKLDLTPLGVEKTFYATIEKIREDDYGFIHLSVKGLEVNDINYRGAFNFSIKDDTVMTCRGENIDVSDLNVGDTIIVTFSDAMIIDIYPTPLQNVTEIQLVDDEK